MLPCIVCCRRRTSRAASSSAEQTLSRNEEIDASVLLLPCYCSFIGFAATCSFFKNTSTWGMTER